MCLIFVSRRDSLVKLLVTRVQLLDSRYTMWMPCLPMVNTNTNYIIGPTKEKIRESYRDFRKKKRRAQHRSRFSRVSFILDKNRIYIAHSRIERSFEYPSFFQWIVCARWNTGWVEKKIFLKTNTEWSWNDRNDWREWSIERYFPFFFFFPSTLIDARRGICGKKKETVVEEKIEAIKRKKTNKNNR